jgi:dTDP-glucose 4,6-dehydratase
VLPKKLLVTGGAGFIGSNFVRHSLERHEDAAVSVLDKLTYAGSIENLGEAADDPRCTFVKGDICDRDVVDGLMAEADAVVHFAAETHVDRSILAAGDFIRTDVFGTFVLLESARTHGVERFVHVSTDEVYGEVLEGSSRETAALMPRNPYSASKAGGDRMAYAFFATYGVPTIITRGSNTYGPYQYPEKLIPFFVTRAMNDEPLPLYGDGQQVRDWLYVRDHCRAIELLLERGEAGEVYNVGAGNERRNIEMANIILDELGKPESLIRFVRDRPGHDRRYALDCSKLLGLGWRPEADFDSEIRATIRWYAEHRDWCDRALARSRAYFEQQYKERQG